MRMDGAMSMTQPSRSSMTLIIRRITFLSCDSVRKKAVTLAGICMSAMM